MQIQRNNLNKFRAKIYRALSDPVRLEIIEFLRGGEKCVCEIIPHVNIIQPMVSRHLKILKDCGLVLYRKDKSRRRYSVTDPRIFEIMDKLTPEMVAGLSRRLIEQITITK